MTLRHARIWIPAGALAAAAVVGTWVVVNTPSRPHFVLLDAAEFLELAGERIGAAEAATNLVLKPLWTSLVFAPGTHEERWGGFSNVTIQCDGMDPVLTGTYLYSGSPRSFRRVAADRGWVDVYTNSQGAKLADYGPSLTHPGWYIIHPGHVWMGEEYSLPRGFGLASGWFLCSDRSSIYSASYNPGIVMAAVDFDPATVTVTATGTNPRGPTYWVPPVITLRTNAMLSGSVLDEVWLTGSWAAGLHAWKSHSATAPLICTRPRQPDIQLDSDTIAAYVDQTFASHGLTDFTGWTNPSPPSLCAGDWGSPRVPLFDTNYLIRAGTDLLRCRTLPCDCYFTDMFVEIWTSRVASGATEDAAFRAVVADPQWVLYDTYPEHPDPYYHGPPDPRVHYRIWRETRVDFDFSVSTTWYARVHCTIRAGTLTADTSFHRGHNTRGHSAVTAHLFCEGGLPFDDGYPAGRLTAVDTRPAADGATLDFGEFPSYRSPPPASWLNLISPGKAESLEWRAEPVAFRAPNFNIIVD